nr:LysM domain-containing protein [Corticibacter populi]
MTDLNNKTDKTIMTTAHVKKHAMRRGAALVAMAVLLPAPALLQAQNYPITAQQRAVAQQTAERGVPVGELRAGAPDTYTVKRGDTLWGISSLYLQKPWHWPQLWGMNLQSIRNPHLIYPGQVLYLDIRDGYARLGLSRFGDDETIKLSPSVREETLEQVALPTIRRDLIEPFLVRPVVKDLDALSQLPVIIASAEERLIMGNGDRLYARGTDAVPLATHDGAARDLSIFRKPKPLKDPQTGEILGYEGEYVGQARIVRDEFFVEALDKRGKPVEEYRPATLDILKAVTEVQIGDQLERQNEATDYAHFVPRVPPEGLEGRVVSLYADQAVANASSNQVVAINLGSDAAVEPGHVFQIMRAGRLVRDPEGGRNARVRLPDEPNGLLLVFRVFDRVAYGLIMDSSDPVTVGDRLVAPQ